MLGIIHLQSTALLTNNRSSTLILSTHDHFCLALSLGCRHYIATWPALQIMMYSARAGHAWYGCKGTDAETEAQTEASSQAPSRQYRSHRQRRGLPTCCQLISQWTARTWAEWAGLGITYHQPTMLIVRPRRLTTRYISHDRAFCSQGCPVWPIVDSCGIGILCHSFNTSWSQFQ
jgi:hypothetical protein